MKYKIRLKETLRCINTKILTYLMMGHYVDASAYHISFEMCPKNR